MTKAEIIEGMARAGTAPKIWRYIDPVTSEFKRLTNQTRDMARRLAIKAATKHYDWLTANGLAVVPMEPTEDMVRVGNYTGYGRMLPPSEVYKAMIQATQKGDKHDSTSKISS